VQGSGAVGDGAPPTEEVLLRSYHTTLRASPVGRKGECRGPLGNCSTKRERVKRVPQVGVFLLGEPQRGGRASGAFYYI